MSDFQEVREHFTSEMVVFGIPGAERVVNDYAVEAEAAEELARSANALNDQDMNDVLPFTNLAEMIEVVCFVDELVADGILARRRHEYASELLQRAREETDHL